MTNTLSIKVPPKSTQFCKNKYLYSYANILCSIPDELKEKIKQLPLKKFIDFLNSLQELNISDEYGIRILLKIINQLDGQDNLFKASKIQDNYIKDIIYNRPHFDTNAKTAAILNAAKDSEGTHIIKYGNLFLNTEKDGQMSSTANISGDESRALGLFTGDMQFVNEYNIKVKGQDNVELLKKLDFSENHNFWCYDENIFGENITLKRHRAVNGALLEKLEISNPTSETIKIKIEISSVIKDIFEVRGKIDICHGSAKIECNCASEIMINTKLPSGNTYGISVAVKDKNTSFYPEKIKEDISKIEYLIEVAPNSTKKLSIKIQPLLNYEYFVDGEILSETPSSYEEALSIINNVKKTKFAKIKIDGEIPNLQKTIDKCLNDLNMLVSYININDKSYSYIDAGLPRYSALFGRDSIITALEIFPLNQDIARDTLELLSLFQGKTFEERHKKELEEIKNSNWPESIKNASIKGIKNLYIQREEAEGKILHELRVGELANLGVIPHTPYYGTVDATPLWLILYCEYYKWSNDKDFLKKLLPNAEAAINWIENNTLNKYLRFKGSEYSKVKIHNQGWKDAGDSIKHVINNKGYLSDPQYPIALAEVQGYVYKAYNMMSEVYQELGFFEKAEDLNQRAEELKNKFNKEFWMEDVQFFTMALDCKNKPVENMTSNIGHCLTMGIIESDKSQIIEDKLMSEEMYTGWGIRTLHSKSPAYNPISYHNGSVWVHDTALVASGLSNKFMANITKNLFEAANMFEDNRLPELFGGFQRKPDDTCIQTYPAACAPQAWASGAPIYLLLKLMNLKIKDNKLILDNPCIPEWIRDISIIQE